MFSILKKKPLPLLIGAAIVFISILSYPLIFKKKEKEKEIRYIAYIGRYTNLKDSTPQHLQTPNKFDKMHEVTLAEYFKKINLPDYELIIKPFDCRKDGKISDSIYKEISKDSSIIAIIDNTWGEHIRHCVNTIKEKELPVIAINADRNTLDYGNNAIFTGNNDHVPYDIGAFIEKVLHIKKINFISEEDYPIHKDYINAFKHHDIQINKLITVNAKPFATEDSIKFYQEIKDFYAANPEEENTLLVVSTHVGIGNGLVNFLDKNYSKLKILGHSYVVNHSHLKKFGVNSRNTMIVISSPTDAVSKPLYHDIEFLKQQYPSYFENPNHPMFVKRCMDAVEIIKNKFEHFSESNKYEVSRKSFIDYFHWLRGKTIREEDEIYEFDSLLTVLPELYFTEYKKGKFHSFPLQLNMQREVIPNLFFGMEIADIYNIDMDANSFTSDFYYWVKLDSNNRDAEKYIIFQNMKQNESSRELIFEKTDGSTIYKLYKVSGIFYVNYELKEYPYDYQELFIRAEILNPSSRLKVSFDQRSFMLDSNAIDKFKITEWEKLKYYVTVDNEINMGLHGDPDIDDEKFSEFKNIYFRLNVKRKITTPMLEIILPLILIGIISISTLFIQDISFENLGEVSIGIFMSIVAFSISFSDSTPTSDDLTKADYMFWVTFIVVLMNFMIVIIVNAIYTPERVKSVDIRKVSIGMGVLYMVTVAWILLK